MKIKEPIVEKQFKEILKPVFNITKTFQSFDKTKDYSAITPINSKGLDVDITPLVPIKDTPSKNNNAVKPKQETFEKKKQQEEISLSKKPPEKKDTPQKEVEKISASEFSPNELNDPDDADCLNSLVVLETKVKAIEAEIAKVEGRPPMNLRQKKMKVSCKLKMLKDSIESGGLSLDKYVGMLATQYQRDIKLCQYFKQNNEINKFKIVEQRLPLLKKELDEGMVMVKKK